MRLSIRVRMVLAMNLLVAAVGVAVGYAGIEVATRQIEQKLVHDSAANAARLIGSQSWPLDSDALMTQVARILGAQTVSSDARGPAVLSSSLSPEQREEFADRLAVAGAPTQVTLAGETYRVGTAPVRRVSPSGVEQLRRFYLLIPERRVLAAQRHVAGRIALFTLAAVVIATVVGFWLSTSLARPIRRLADRMDHLAAEEAAGALSGALVRRAGEDRPRLPRRTPGEVARLTRSFDDLLASLAAARRQLERSARLAGLGQLAASVAHELRNPLSGIKMNARVLADELDRCGQADRSLELIVREIDRMDLYLQELLSLASAPAGEADRPQPDAQPVRLEELADSVVSLLAGRCEHAGVTIGRRYEPDAPAGLAEPGRIRQVMLNLMLNAVDAMPHGGRMALSVRRGGGGTVRLEVADAGRGVKVAGGADIFEPFVTTKPQGTGLGLYICRQAVQAFGGRIGYDSSPEGSTFWFELPAAP
jgi:signal transduction histidine kinase